jgi:galactokinase
MTILPHVDAPIHLLASFAQVYPESASEFTLRVPGRALWIAGCRRADRQFRVASVELGGRTALTYQSAKQRQTLNRRPLPAWAHYVAGMAIFLADKQVDCPGFNIVVAGDEGDAARYIYALGAAFGTAYYHCAGIAAAEATLMDDLEHVRRGYVNQS